MNASVHTFEDFVLLTRLFENLAQLHNLGRLLARAYDSSESKSLSHLTRLERSLASRRNLVFAKDSTQPLARFIDNTGRILCQQVEYQALKQIKDEVRAVSAPLT